MKKEEVRAIIEKEKLKYYNWFEDHELRENELLIYKNDNRWEVSATSERGGIVTGSILSTESEEQAFEIFLSRLRSLNRLKDNNLI